MNTLEHNRFTASWRSFGLTVERPAAVLAISAHWCIDASAVTSMAQPRVIHDFYGFPQELFDFDYRAPGSPEIARLVAELAHPTLVELDDDTWGIDHGTWSVLAHMFPQADVPVVQLAIDASQSLDYHLELGSRLDALRDEGVLILASGNIVHNLRAIDWSAGEQGFEWAQRFDDDARGVMQSDASRLGELLDSDDYPAAVPTTDHFLPLAYFAGLAAVAGERPRTLVDGCILGSLSMTSYVIGDAIS